MKKSKLLCLILSIVLVLSCTVNMFGCGDDDSNNEDQNQTEYGENVTLDIEDHYITNGLHKVTVTENADRTFIVNNKTDYTIITDGTDGALASAQFIVTQLKNIGTVITRKAVDNDIVEDWTANDKYIVLNCSEIFEKAGLSMPSDNLGASGYYIETVGNTVFIMNPQYYGYQMGARKFLEEVIGYDCYGENCFSYDKDGATIPDMKIIEKPDFDYRASSDLMSSSAWYNMGYNLNGVYSLYLTVPDHLTKSGGAPLHNSFYYLPPDEYYLEHTDWFWQPYVANEAQLCYTANGAVATAEADREDGTPNEYNLMLDTVAEYMQQLFISDPSKSVATFTQQDDRGYCKCDYCQSLKNKYGTPSAAIIMFLNDLEEIMNSEDKKQERVDAGGYEDVTILFFAYQSTSASPTNYVDGKYVAIDENVIMNEHVGVFIAAIDSVYTHSFYEQINIDDGESEHLKSWGSLTQNLFLWFYESNFGGSAAYFLPYNSWGASVECYRFAKEINGNYMFNEGQNGQQNPSCFSRFKDYIDAKAEVNVNVSYVELKQKFFANFYGNGGDAMLKLFNELENYLTYLEGSRDELTGHLSEEYFKSEYWPYQMLVRWLGYIDEAYEAISNIGTNHAVYEKNIMVDSLFIRYMLIQLYANYYSSSELNEARVAFKSDNETLQNTRCSEGSLLSGIYTNWGV